MEDALVSFDLCRVILTRGNLGTRVKKFVYIKYRHITTQSGQNTECESPFRVDECLCVYCKNHHTRLAFLPFLPLRRILFSVKILLSKTDYRVTPVLTNKVTNWRACWSCLTGYRGLQVYQVTKTA